MLELEGARSREYNQHIFMTKSNLSWMKIILRKCNHPIFSLMFLNMF